MWWGRCAYPNPAVWPHLLHSVYGLLVLPLPSHANARTHMICLIEHPWAGGTRALPTPALLFITVLPFYPHLVYSPTPLCGPSRLLTGVLQFTMTGGGEPLNRAAPGHHHHDCLLPHNGPAVSMQRRITCTTPHPTTCPTYLFAPPFYPAPSTPTPTHTTSMMASDTTTTRRGDHLARIPHTLRW